MGQKTQQQKQFRLYRDTKQKIMNGNNYSNTNGGGCGTNPNALPVQFVTQLQPDYSCPSACPAPNRVAPNVQYFDASNDCRIEFDVASATNNRIIIFGLGAIDDANNAFVRDELFGKLPAAFAEAPIVNDTNAQVQWLSKLFSYNTYVSSRILIDITGTEAVQQSQFNQRLHTYTFTFDPFTGCENSVRGLTCAPCEGGGFNEQVYTSCEIVTGLHAGLVIPVVAGATLAVQMCICRAGIGENMVDCVMPNRGAQVNQATQFNG